MRECQRISRRPSWPTVTTPSSSAPASPTLAARLSRQGMKTAVIERKLVGGTCVNVGCIPTKALVASAGVAHLARRSADFGVAIEGPVRVDMAGDGSESWMNCGRPRLRRADSPPWWVHDGLDGRQGDSHLGLQPEQGRSGGTSLGGHETWRSCGSLPLVQRALARVGRTELGGRRARPGLVLPPGPTSVRTARGGHEARQGAYSADCCAAN
jgi:hypothetical protein